MTVETISELFNIALETGNASKFDEAVLIFSEEITIAPGNKFPNKYFNLFYQIFIDVRSRQFDKYVDLLLEVYYERNRLTENQRKYIKNEIIDNISEFRDTRQLQQAIYIIISMHNGEDLFEIMSQLMGKLAEKHIDVYLYALLIIESDKSLSESQIDFLRAGIKG